MKKVSVITISYNNVRGLKKTIESVIAQTFADVEHVVVDGGSSDGSVELVKSYGNRIHRFVSEKDNGIYNAQNKGIGMASGEYLLFLNSGDFLCDETVLAKIVPYLDGSTIVYGDMRINWGGGGVSHGKMPEVITKEHMFVDTLWHPVSLIPRVLFERYGKYDESLKLVADYDFFFRVLFRHGVNTRHVPLEICEFSADGASSSKANKKLEKTERLVVQKRYLESNELNKLAVLHGPAWKRWVHKVTRFFR